MVKTTIRTDPKAWIKFAGIRAIKTAAQTAVASIGTTALMGEVNWIAVGSTALLAAIVSMLTSLAGLPESREEAAIEATEGDADDLGV